MTRSERHAPRTCAVCASEQPAPIHRQRFRRFDDDSGLHGYEVVACRRCGFVYADQLPSQDVFDRYYRDLSKYESHDSGGDVAPWAATIHRSIVDDVSARLPARNARILDVGSASGHLLAAFRAAGFENVVGFDPSQRCSELARERYGVRVINDPISKIALDGERFDLILLASVLEHLRDVGAAIRSLSAVLAPAGAIWFEVPDAGRFAEHVHSPFHQFSLEHINFFTRTSLTGLMQQHGFVPSDCWEVTRVVGSMPDPGLDAIFVAGKQLAHDVSDRIGPAEVRRYAKLSAALEQTICDRLATMTANDAPVILWGTGSLTMHLLTLEAFRALNIAAFVDANVNYQGKTIGGVPILSPQQVRFRREPIVVASHASENDIMATIRTKLGLPNRVIGLVSGIDSDVEIAH